MTWAAWAFHNPGFVSIGGPTRQALLHHVVGHHRTTSMARWLRQHPAIFMPAIKEPNFFNTDINRPPIYGVGTLDAYEALFAPATAAQRRIGEASVFYLSSTVAVQNILRYQPNARFIVMLRNPVDMAPALHAEMLVHGLENVRDFATAWKLQYHRRHGRHIPALSNSWGRQFQFAEVCALGTQLERLFTTVSRDRVLIILLDDIVANRAANTYERCDSSEWTTTPVRNFRSTTVLAQSARRA